jgi:hypothetical protein
MLPACLHRTSQRQALLAVRELTAHRNRQGVKDNEEIRVELHDRLVAQIDSIGDPFFTFKATDRSGKELF